MNQPAKTRVTDAQITAAKVALDAARRMNDLLRIALAEDALNDLLDRYSYHTSHTSQRRDK